MYVFYALVVIGLILIWLFLSKFFTKIGQVAEKTTKGFNEELKEMNRKEESKNEK